jgi:hypothetical protein
MGIAIYLLILHSASEALDKHIFGQANIAIHADLDIIGYQHIVKVCTGGLTAFVGIEGIRATIGPDGLSTTSTQ